MGASITPYSAALVLGNWITENGRVPKTSELHSENGLLNFVTFCNIFGSWQSAIQAANIVMSAPEQFNAMFPGRIRPCMRCGVDIHSPGNHVRHCYKCRHHLFSEDEGDDRYGMPHYVKSAMLEEYDFDLSDF